MQPTETFFVGVGNLRVADSANGVPGGFSDPLNAVKFELFVEADQKKVVSTKRDTAGQTLASRSRITAATVKLTINGYDADMLAAFFLGSLEDIPGSGGMVTDEPMTAVLDRWLLVAQENRGIDDVVVSNSDSSTVYVEGDDYLVDMAAGMIKPLGTGAITDGQDLLVDYRWRSDGGVKLLGATTPEVHKYLHFDGVNEFTGESARVKVFCVSLKPASGADYLAEDPAELEFEGELITPPGMSHPFEII